MQTFGNLCLSLAAILDLIPLQHLLIEIARKRDDGGAAIAGILVLGPMWLLLLVGMILATAQGGFDGLPLRRGLHHALIIAATLALAVAVKSADAGFDFSTLPGAFGDAFVPGAR